MLLLSLSCDMFYDITINIVVNVFDGPLNLRYNTFQTSYLITQYIIKF